MPDKADLLQGTLDLLILRTLRSGEKHGYAIAHHIQQTSEGFLQVEEDRCILRFTAWSAAAGSEAQWGLSHSRRKAKYYQLTSAGTQLKAKTKTWQALVDAIGSVLKAPAGEA